MAVCSTPGCAELVDRGRCPSCLSRGRKASDAKRPSSPKRGYGRAWAKRRADYLAGHPRCVDCGAGSTEAHHRVRRRVLVEAGVADPDHDQWLMALCKRCHSKRTARGE